MSAFTKLKTLSALAAMVVSLPLMTHAAIPKITQGYHHTVQQTKMATAGQKRQYCSDYHVSIINDSWETVYFSSPSLNTYDVPIYPSYSGNNAYYLDGYDCSGQGVQVIITNIYGDVLFRGPLYNGDNLVINDFARMQKVQLKKAK